MNITTGKEEHIAQGRKYIERTIESQPDYVKSFYYYIRNSGKTSSYNTQRVYVEHVIRFLNKVDKDIDKITIDDITIYLANMSDKKDGTQASGSYLVAVYSALKKFFDYLIFSERITKNPIEHVERPRPKKPDLVHRTFLTKNEIKKCINATDEESGIYRVRDKAILTVFFATGIRNTCLTEINVDNIDFENNVIHVVDKGTKSFTCNLAPEQMETIKKWVDVRKEIISDENEKALFVTMKGKRMSQQATASVVKKASSAIGHKISPHKARASYCTLAYNSGIPIDIVSKLMNHSSIKTTMDCYIQGQEERIREARIKAANNVKF